MDRIWPDLVFKKEIMKKRVFKVANHGVSIYPLCLLGEVLYYDFHKLYGKNYEKSIAEFSQGVNRFAIMPGSHEKISHLITPKVIDNLRWVKQFFKKIYQNSAQLLNQADRAFKTDLTKKNGKELLTFYQSYNQKFKQMYLYGWLPNAVEGLESIFSDKLEFVLANKLKKLNKSDKIGEYFSILTTPAKDSEREREQKDFLKLLSGAKKGKDLANRLKSHQAKYCWLQYNYDGPALSLNYFINQAKQYSKVNPDVQLEKIIRQKKELVGKQRLFIEELKLSDRDEYLFWLGRQFAFIKNYRKDILYKSYYPNDRLLKEIGRRLGLSVRQVKHILPQEMPKILLGGKVDSNLLNQRIKYSVLFYGPKTPKVFVGGQAKKIIKQRVGEEKVETKTSELKGQVAFSGRAKGKVKIVNAVGDMIGFKKGQILVSGKTNPNLIAAMKRAAAIVTDQGGLTSHAAIVSRELKIPCVVGTKIATEVLKNGDQVEVDANQGIVRKA